MEELVDSVLELNELDAENDDLVNQWSLLRSEYRRLVDGMTKVRFEKRCNKIEKKITTRDKKRVRLIRKIERLANN